MYTVDLPMPIGTTLGPEKTTDCEGMLGRQFVIQDKTTKLVRKLRLVRNTSGGTLLPKMVVDWDSSATYIGTSVSNYHFTSDSEFAGVVDDQLPSTGVADDDIFYLIEEGPATVLVDTSAVSVTKGGLLMGVTAAGSTAATTALGRITPLSITGAASTSTDAATALIALNHFRGVIGKALSAATSGSTSGCLVDVRRLF